MKPISFLTLLALFFILAASDDARAGCKENGGVETGCVLAKTVWVQSNNDDPGDPRWPTQNQAYYGILPNLTAACTDCNFGLRTTPFPSGTMCSPGCSSTSYSHPDDAPNSLIKGYTYAWGDTGRKDVNDNPIYAHSGILPGIVAAEPICPGKKPALETAADGQKHYYCKPFKDPNSNTRDVVDSMSGADSTTEGCTVGCNPVNLTTGTKYDYAIDYANLSPYPIVWARHYNSRMEGWTFSYTQRIEAVLPASGLARVKMVRADGSLINLKTTSISTTSSPSTWVMDMGTNQTWKGKLVDVRDGSGVLTGWNYTNLNDEIEQFDANGRLLYVQNLAGERITMTYDTHGRLSRIDDDFGRFLNLSYLVTPTTENVTWDDPNSADPDNPDPADADYQQIADEDDAFLQEQISSVSDGASTVSYTYISTVVTNAVLRHLHTVQQADLSTITYQYSSTNGALVGILDENNNQYATYTYDSFNRVLTSVHGAGFETITYTWTSSSSMKVKDARNHTATFDITPGRDYSINKTGGSDVPCTACGGAKAGDIVYDAYGNPTSSTDFEGVVTTRTYDTARGLPLTVTEASGDPEQRTTTITWHANFRLPLTIVRPVLVGGVAKTQTETYTYNASGKPLTRTLSTNAGGSNRVWTYTYNADGWLETVTEPNGAVSRYDYDLQGNLTKETLADGTALEREKTFGGYDTAGRLGWTLDPNGFAQRFTWDLRGRLTKQEVGTPGGSGPGGTGGTWETTEYEYAAIGKVGAIDHPDGTRTEFTYDTAQRLTQVKDKDSGGNQISKLVYTLDNASNVTGETLYDAANNVSISATSTYDTFNRISQSKGATNQTTTITYNDEDVVESVTDPLIHATTRTLDNLYRPTTITDALSNDADITYGPSDEVLTATDQRGVQTQYAYNGFGDITGVISPDRGTWAFGYNAYGQKTTTTDPRGVVATATYDILGRPTQVVFDDAGVAGFPAGFVAGDQTRTYAYDSCTNGIGRLCALTDETGVTGFSYDDWGRVVGKSWVGASGTPAAGITLSTGYSYDSAGRLDAVTYPSGKSVAIAYGIDGKPVSLDHGAQAVIRNLEWTAFDAVKGWTWGFGGMTTGEDTVAFDYDGDGAVEQIADTDTRDYVVDNAGRITAIDDPVDPTKSQVYEYDALNRLTEADVGSWADSLGYGYDAASNRTSKVDNATNNGWNYAYGLSSNRMASRTPVTSGTPGSTITQTYDAMGSLINDGAGLTLGYDAAGRLATSSLGASGTVQTYNGLGQRVRKSVSGSGAGTTLFAYDEVGRLLGSYVPDSGAPGGFRVQEELVWLDGFRPVLSVRPNATTGMTAPDYYPVLTDHLGTPRKVLNDDGDVAWSWDAKEPFGNSVPNENPGGLGVFKLNLRFPGQWFDTETGLYHNGFRDYHPGLGRYVQSDPLGMEAGWNTYAYVDQNPLSYSDFLGLARQYSFGVGGTIAAAVLGSGGSASVGISVPDNWRKWKCYQVTLNGQWNTMVGGGLFLGGGLNVGTGHSKGPLESTSLGTYRYEELVGGWGNSGGISHQGSEELSQAPGAFGWLRRLMDKEGWENDIPSGASMGILPRVGAGYGLWAGMGYTISGGLATPVWDECGCK